MSRTIIKISRSARSQTVRLPKAFRFATEQVRIRRYGAAIILEPVPDNWSWLDKLPAPDQDFIDAATTRPAAAQYDNPDEISDGS